MGLRWIRPANSPLSFGTPRFFIGQQTLAPFWRRLRVVIVNNYGTVHAFRRQGKYQS